MANTGEIELITGKEAMAMIGVTHQTTMYRRIKAGTFPKPVKLGSRSNRFVKSECEEFVRKMLQARDHGSS